eukprot:6214837-Pleurochrysis_carterae.AAC.18
MLPRPRDDEDVACHACEPPHVLILQVGAVAPAQYEQRDHDGRVGRDVARNVEFGGQLRVLGVTDAHAVDVHVDCRGHGAEMQRDAVLSGRPW